MRKVKLKGSRFLLERSGDRAGQDGNLYSISLNTKKQIGQVGEIRVGCLVFCSGHDAWWRTSPVVKIIDVNDNLTEVTFATLNSFYTAKVVY